MNAQQSTKSQNPSIFGFGDTQVLLVLPERLRVAETVLGYIGGTWTACREERDSFSLSSVEAWLAIPSSEVILPGTDEVSHFGRITIPLEMADVEIPSHFQDVFGPVNRGRFDVKQRSVTTTFGLMGYLPELPELEPTEIAILLRTMAFVETIPSPITKN